MPTHNDETLHDRYTREHLTHLARLATMTPDQIAAMELDLHNALAEVDRLRAQQNNQEGEAVEVVATVEAYGGKWAGIHWGECIGSTEDPERQLMTVAQHQRIMAAATHPANQVADDLTMVKASRELLEQIAVELEHDNDRYFLGRELRALLNGGRDE